MGRGIRKEAIFLDDSDKRKFLWKLNEVMLPTGGVLERGPGSFVGELSLLTDTPRTARVSCTSHVRGLAISRADFAKLLVREPTIALSMLHELARRLTEDARYGGPPTQAPDCSSVP